MAERFGGGFSSSRSRGQNQLALFVASDEFEVVRRPKRKPPLPRFDYGGSTRPRTAKKDKSSEQPQSPPSSALDVTRPTKSSGLKSLPKKLRAQAKGQLKKSSRSKIKQEGRGSGSLDVLTAKGTMGWGQPSSSTTTTSTGPVKRGRHSSEENNRNDRMSADNGNLGEREEFNGNGGARGGGGGDGDCSLGGGGETSIPFVKRPRSTPTDPHSASLHSLPTTNNELLSSPKRLMTMTAGSGSDSKSDSAMNVPSPTAPLTEEYSKTKGTVIVDPMPCEGEPISHSSSSSSSDPNLRLQSQSHWTDGKDNEEEQHLLELGQLKIRTSAPKLAKSGGKPQKRGPRVPTASGKRSATPRKMSPVKTKNGSKLIPASASSSTASSSRGEGESTSTSTSTFSEEEAYVDLNSEEEDDVEVVDSEGEGSMADDISAATSVDMIPPEAENAVPEIVPAIRPSYFPFVPPYLNFCLHNQRTEPLPKEIQKQMKWRLSNITPVVVKKTLSNSGFRLLRKTVEWSGQWGRHMKAALFKTSLKDFQKINHLPGTFQVGRKDRLWRNIQRYSGKFGKDEFGFMPKTFVLPLETKQLKVAWDSAENCAKGQSQLWIVKPPAGARGTGIRVVNRWAQVPKKKPIIVQSYIGAPYLINDRKFDLRLYVLVTNFHPLKVYLYNDGLVRFAPVKYSNDSKRAGDRFMHLTNYSINKNCELYTHNEEPESCEGHKWTLKSLWRHFVKEGKDVVRLWTQIEEIVIKTLICAEEPIVNAASCYLPNLYNGYELLGFDIILDSDLKPWLLEVNISPSLHSSSPLDLAVKGPMINELFNIVGYHLPPKMSPVLKTMFSNSLDVPLELETPVFDKRIYTNSLSKDEQAKHKMFKSKFEKRGEYLEEILSNLTPDDVRHLLIAEDELSQCHNFSRIYPTTTTHSYTPYFELPRYYNMLFDAWEAKYNDDRPSAVKRLITLCRQKIHLQVPVNAGSMISESQVAEDAAATNTESWQKPLAPSSTILTSDKNDEKMESLIENDKLLEHGSSLFEFESQEEKLMGSISTSSLSSPPSNNSNINPTSSVLDNITNTNINNCNGNGRPLSTTGNNGETRSSNSISNSNSNSTSKASSLSPVLPTNNTNNASSNPNSNSASIPNPTPISSPKVTDLPKGICF